MGSSDVDNTKEQIIKNALGVGFEMHFSARFHLMFYRSIPFRPISGNCEVA